METLGAFKGVSRDMGKSLTFGLMEKKMETTSMEFIQGSGFKVWGLE